MGYISKKSILKAYKTLSRLSYDPSVQGATQKVSAIRYFMALDEFYKAFDKDCNTQDKNDKEEYAKFVGTICDVCPNLYTTNFFVPLKEHSGDYCVGSNFYSAGQVRSSLVNRVEEFPYPKRGGSPLFNIKNGVLKRDVSYYKNICSYIDKEEHKVAISIWILRNEDLDENLLSVQGIHKYLSKKYTVELINFLFKDISTFTSGLNQYDLELEPQKEEIEESDINDLFKIEKSMPNLECLIVNPVDSIDYTEIELSGILKKMYDQGQQDKSATFRIILFGLKYGTIIKEKDFKIKQIVKSAGLNESYATEVNKGVGLASLISKNANGISFWNEDMQIKVERKRKRSSETTPTINESLKPYLSALRTKPFLLLAGISGTGKSRIVKEMAYESCPDKGDLQSDPITPGNYCLVEVKPNWNDSTELLGYESVLNGGCYHLTPFVKFVVKAMKYPNVPFFVCLDEMNLAPVEQYFAEFLSVLESRKDKNGKIESEALVAADYFVKYEETLRMELGIPNPEEDNAAGYGSMATDSAVSYGDLYENLKTKGLRIPQNLIVVGTVNMDDTTYQFSRKVIDRAMTIEMNEVNLDKMFDDSSRTALDYRTEPVGKEWYLAPYAQSGLALESKELANDKEALKEAIYKNFGQTDDHGVATEQSLEEILGNTPFRVAYRVVNELILHFAALRWEAPEASFEEIFMKAFDNILMMKVLPRIEGNEDLVSEPLKKLFSWTENIGCFQSHRKVGEMLVRLDANHFTSFWP